MRHLLLRAALVAGALSVLGAGATVRAATTENFMVRTTADFVALCETAPGQDNYVAAIHFCQGFASGAYQYYQAMTSRDPASRFVCPPSPPPSRNQAIANYLAWARSNPSVMRETPVDTIFRFLAQTYPCASTGANPSGTKAGGTR